MTLPLIYALNNTDRSQKRTIINIIRNHNEEPERVAEVIAFVHKSGGLQYAKGKMNEYKEKALSILNSFPENEARRSLQELVIYTTERNK
jgi:octaprenyl-diphosphate synthase